MAVWDEFLIQSNILAFVLIFLSSPANFPNHVLLKASVSDTEMSSQLSSKKVDYLQLERLPEFNHGPFTLRAAKLS